MPPLKSRIKPGSKAAAANRESMLAAIAAFRDLEKRVYTNPVFGGMRDFDDTFRNRLGRFVEQLNEGAGPEQIEASGEDGLKAQKVLAAAIESVRSGGVVAVAA